MWSHTLGGRRWCALLLSCSISSAFQAQHRPAWSWCVIANGLSPLRALCITRYKRKLLLSGSTPVLLCTEPQAVFISHYSSSCSKDRISNSQQSSDESETGLCRLLVSWGWMLRAREWWKPRGVVWFDPLDMEQGGTPIPGQVLPV